MLKTIQKFFKGSLGFLAIKSSIFIFSYLVYSCSEIDIEVSNEHELEQFRQATFNSSMALFDRVQSVNSRTNSDMEGTIEGMNEKMLILIIEPMVSSGVSLLKSYGITEEEIIAEFGNLNSPDISRAALAISQVEDLANAGYTIEGFDDSDFALANFVAQSAHASQIYDCALQAAGITVLVELAESGIKKLGKKGAMKLVKKVASKYLGWAGAAIAAYEFGNCMEWW